MVLCFGGVGWLGGVCWQYQVEETSRQTSRRRERTDDGSGEPEKLLGVSSSCPGGRQSVFWGGGVLLKPWFATAAHVCRGRGGPAESPTCQRLHRRPESAASVGCSSVVSEASLVFYCRQKEIFSHLQNNQHVHDNE